MIHSLSGANATLAVDIPSSCCLHLPVRLLHGLTRLWQRPNVVRPAQESGQLPPAASVRLPIRSLDEAGANHHHFRQGISIHSCMISSQWPSPYRTEAFESENPHGTPDWGPMHCKYLFIKMPSPEQRRLCLRAIQTVLLSFESGCLPRTLSVLSTQNYSCPRPSKSQDLVVLFCGSGYLQGQTFHSS